MNRSFVLLIALFFNPLTAQTSYDVIADAMMPGLSSLKEEDEILSSHERYATVLSILKDGSKHRNIAQKTTLNKTTINDLNILFYDTSKPHFTVLKGISRTKTTLGECSLANMLLTPTTDITLLKERQRVIKFLVENDGGRIALQNLITPFAEKEPQLLALWNKNDIIYGNNMAQLLFSGKIAKLRSPISLELRRRFYDVFESLSPIFGLAGTQFLKTFFFEKEQDGRASTKEKIFNGVSVSFTALGLAIAWKTMYSKLRNRRMLIASLKQKLHSLVALGETLINVGAYGRRFSSANIAPIKVIQKFSGKQNTDIHTFFHSLTSKAFQQDKGYFSLGLGSVLASLSRFLSIQSRLTSVLSAIGELDALLSIATLVREYQNLENHYCYATYEKLGSGPHLSIEGFWHPNLQPNRAIANSIELGGKMARNMTITGPNAGGKSTIIKGIVLASLFAQTITVVPAKAIHLTPFAHLNTYLNIVEDAGNALSQHRAEVRRANELITQIMHLKENEYALTVMDEMFRCTNPAAGAAAAYGIGKELGKCPSSLLILATHYFHLTKLSDEQTSQFTNHHVAAYKNNDGSFTYPYTLKPGINATVIALDLLAREGFDERVLQYAYEHLKRVESKEGLSEYTEQLIKRTTEEF